jgi:hypothetical protein
MKVPEWIVTPRTGHESHIEYREDLLKSHAFDRGHGGYLYGIKDPEWNHMRGKAWDRVVLNGPDIIPKGQEGLQSSRTPMAIFRACLLRAVGFELPEVRLIFGERMEYLSRLATILISDLF